MARPYALARTGRPATARRIGYLITIISSAALLYLINVGPGWQTIPLLTSATPQVLGILNVFLTVAIVVNAVVIFHDPPLFRVMGEYVIGSFRLAVLLRIWMIFPFDFNGLGIMSAVLVRSLLLLATATTLAGLSTRLIRMRKTIETYGTRPLSARNDYLSRPIPGTKRPTAVA